MSDTNPQNTKQAGYLRSYNSGQSVTFTFSNKTGTYRVRCIKNWN